MALGTRYATADDLRSRFGIDDVDDDAQLEDALDAASDWVTSWCGRDFNQADTATARLYYPRGSVVEVDDIASTTGMVVGTDEDDDGVYEVTWTVSTEFVLEPLNGVMDGITGWPYTRLRSLDVRSWPTYAPYRPPVTVTALWGWPAVPAAVKSATLIMAARLFGRRNSPDGVLGGFEFGPIRVGTRLDPDVEALLEPYRKQIVQVA